MTTTTSKSRKFIELAGGHCGMLPADESLCIPEVWQVVKDPARWIGIGKTLNRDECRAMLDAGELTQVGEHKITGAVIYKLTEAQA